MSAQTGKGWGGVAMVFNKGENSKGMGDGLKRTMQIKKSHGANCSVTWV